MEAVEWRSGARQPDPSSRERHVLSGGRQRQKLPRGTYVLWRRVGIYHQPGQRFRRRKWGTQAVVERSEVLGRVRVGSGGLVTPSSLFAES